MDAVPFERAPREVGDGRGRADRFEGGGAQVGKAAPAGGVRHRHGGLRAMVGGSFVVRGQTHPAERLRLSGDERPTTNHEQPRTMNLPARSGHGERGAPGGAARASRGARRRRLHGTKSPRLFHIKNDGLLSKHRKLHCSKRFCAPYPPPARWPRLPGFRSPPPSPLPPAPPPPSTTPPRCSRAAVRPPPPTPRAPAACTSRSARRPSPASPTRRRPPGPGPASTPTARAKWPPPTTRSSTASPTCSPPTASRTISAPT